MLSYLKLEREKDVKDKTDFNQSLLTQSPLSRR
jgi:hypothetical protein